MCLFLSSVLGQTSKALRIFYIPHSGSGDTVLQINVFGSLDEGQSSGFIDLLATGGDMRRLQPGNDTLPRDSANWSGVLAGFAVVHPWLDAGELLDSEKGNVDSTHWLTCRQCRGMEKGPIDPTSFYNSTKLTSHYPSAIILENSRTGGYPCPDDPKLDPTNGQFPIRDKDWRQTVRPATCVDQFRNAASQPFSPLQSRRAALFGNDVIKHYGALHLGLRAIQEPELEARRELVLNAKRYLVDHPDLCADISELHHLGDIPKFLGPSPGPFRVRGLPNSTSQQDFMLTKLWNYVAEGKMFARTSDGIPCGAEFFCSLPPPSLRSSPTERLRAIRGPFGRKTGELEMSEGGLLATKNTYHRRSRSAVL